MSLIPQIVDSVKIPVIAAGGVGDSRSIVAMYASVKGVQAGTIFLSADECPIPDSYKQRVINATDTDTIVTGRKSGHPVRSFA